MATQLSILTAVLDGQADALRNLLAALPLRDGSPFAAVRVRTTVGSSS